MRYMLALLVLKVLPQGVRAALLNWLTPGVFYRPLAF
jgi:hypothetical protein